MTKCMQSHEHQYIFEPVCASVLLRRNTSKEPLRSRNNPRIEGQVQLEPTSLRLSQVCMNSLWFSLTTVAFDFMSQVFYCIFKPRQPPSSVIKQVIL